MANVTYPFSVRIGGEFISGLTLTWKANSVFNLLSKSAKSDAPTPISEFGSSGMYYFDYDPLEDGEFIGIIDVGANYTPPGGSSTPTPAADRYFELIVTEDSGRLQRLDAAMTSRATAEDVWMYQTDDTAMITSGTVGKQMVDNVDAKVSDLPTATEIWSAGTRTITGGTVATVTNDVGITQAAADKVWGTTVRQVTGGTVTTVTNDVGITQGAADKVWSTTARTITGGTVASVTNDVGITQEAANKVWDTTARTVTGGTITTVGTVTNDVGITQASADKVWNTTGRTITGGTVTTVTNDVGITQGAADKVWNTASRETTGGTIEDVTNMVTITQASADKVWGSTSRTVTGGTIGAVTSVLDVVNNVGITQSAADKVWNTAARQITGGVVTSVTNAVDITQEGANRVWATVSRTVTGGTVTTATNVTNVDNAVDITQGAADKVWDSTARTVTGGTVTSVTNAVDITQGAADRVWDSQTKEITGGTVDTVTNDVDISQSAADKVWGTTVREVTGGEVDAVGVTTGFELSASNIEDIAEAVWNTTRAGHATAGTFGQGVASVQGNVTGTVVGDVSVGVVKDKTGYALTTNERTAIGEAVAATNVSGYSAESMAGTLKDVQTSSGDNLQQVDHDFGGADALRYMVSPANVIPIADASIKVYLKSDWDANRRSESYVREISQTDDAGRWVTPCLLAAGTYTVVFELENQYGPDTVDITVT